jgi:hypothetical protein
VTAWLIVLTLIALSLLAAVAWSCEAKGRRQFASRFPPISDDEFVELCGPGTNREVALRVRRIVADQLGVDHDRIHPSSSFANDLGCA